MYCLNTCFLINNTVFTLDEANLNAEQGLSGPTEADSDNFGNLLVENVREQSRNFFRYYGRPPFLMCDIFRWEGVIMRAIIQMDNCVRWDIAFANDKGVQNVCNKVSPIHDCLRCGSMGWISRFQ